MARRLGVDDRRRRRRRLRRDEGARGVDAAVPAAAHARARHRAAPGHRLPDLRHGRHARRLPAGRLRDASTTSTPPTPTGRCACGSTARPTPTASSSTSARRRHGAATAACRCCRDECYVEFTWEGRGRTILEHGADGVLAVHSLSKRSNLAGARAGCYAGDAELVRFLGEVRKHAGLHGARARCRPRRWRPGPTTPTSTPSARSTAAASPGCARCSPPSAATRRCPPAASTCGRRRPTATPGAWRRGWPSGPGSSSRRARPSAPAAPAFVRVAAVQPDDRIELVAARLGV